MTRDARTISEFGDFQTPPHLAAQVCRLASNFCGCPGSIVEPTCGVGNFLVAALREFPQCPQVVGADINAEYVRAARAAAAEVGGQKTVRLNTGSFFDTPWPDLIRDLPGPVLVIGNPPWVTNSGLGAMQSGNVPRKENLRKDRGIDAMTGRSNFDISEWMLIRLVDWLDGREATIAMLCKTAVARKVVSYAWRQRAQVRRAEIHGIDAASHFDAAVDACLLMLQLAPGLACDQASVFQSLGFHTPTGHLGCRDGRLVADVRAYDRWKHLIGGGTTEWRSGIKHDCAAVMELRREASGLHNGLGDRVLIEEEFVYPLLKSSDVAAGRTQAPRRAMIVTQRAVGEDTAPIERKAPLTWRYLERHADRFARRASSIYRNQPAYSIFGIGDYSFAPWKVAISGLYKRLAFSVVGTVGGRPIVLDDTVYFHPCPSEEQATFVASLLKSDVAREFFSGLIFWDAKRPITVDVLRRLDLPALARELGRGTEAERLLRSNGRAPVATGRTAGEMMLFD